jgi:glutathione S-transferase
MSYTLVIGEKNYSSWSMRAWLVMKHLGLAFREVSVHLYRDGSRQAVRDLGGQTGLVPVLKDGDVVIWETLAIFEHLFESHPAVWPRARRDRARARSLAGEVHSGLNALRAAMPVNTRARGRVAHRTPAVDAEIARVVAVWENTGPGGPWLFDRFGGADIMFAPVATRFQTYGVELTGRARTYQNQLLAHPLVAEWLALGRAETNVIPALECP